MLLSICIPTYNRSEKVCELLKYLEYEIEKIEGLNFKFEILVGDNSSDLLTQNICINSKLYKQNTLKYIKNESNIGLIGNVLNLASKSNGEFVWIIGDDDIYHRNILFFIKESILEDDYSYIYLNHRAYEDGKKGFPGSGGFDSAVDLNKRSIYEDGKVMAFDIWKHSQTSLMFISASVFNKKYLKKCLKSKKSIDIAYPLYMSFFCAAQGKSKIIKKICIDNIWGATSWSDSQSRIFKVYVPKILYSLPKIKYAYFQSRFFFFNYLLIRIKGMLISSLHRIIIRSK
jgi:glycosyltransferase involved in cell wall biosynthesis